MNLYVSNLGFNIKDEDLRELFAPFGEVASAKVITDRMTNQSRGFGFVEMPDDASSKNAISELDQSVVDGRTIKVVEARPKESNNNSRGNKGW